MTNFNFVKSDGSSLSSSDLNTLVGDLNDGVEITLYIRANGATKQPGIFLVPASSYGEVVKFSNTSRHTDWNNILTWASETVPDGVDLNLQDNKGMYIKTYDIDADIDYTSNDIGSQLNNIVIKKYYFKHSQGSTYSNMIPLINMHFLNSSGGIFPYTIGFENNSAVETKRLYVGLQISDIGEV